LEGQLLDQKSLRAVTGKTADWNEIAKDCIAFANATGGRLLLGIEDGQSEPPGGCAEFCVNGQSTAGASLYVRKYNDTQEARSTARTAGQPAGRLQKA
jgi:predicted HTH transcriptional regulator